MPSRLTLVVATQFPQKTSHKSWSLSSLVVRKLNLLSDPTTLNVHKPPTQDHNQKLSYDYFMMKDFVCVGWTSYESFFRQVKMEPSTSFASQRCSFSVHHCATLLLMSQSFYPCWILSQSQIKKLCISHWWHRKCFHAEQHSFHWYLPVFLHHWLKLLFLTFS